MRVSIRRVDGALQTTSVGATSSGPMSAGVSELILAIPIGTAAYYGYKWWGIGGAIGLPVVAFAGIFFFLMKGEPV